MACSGRGDNKANGRDQATEDPVASYGSQHGQRALIGHGPIRRSSRDHWRSQQEHGGAPVFRWVRSRPPPEGGTPTDVEPTCRCYPALNHALNRARQCP